VADAYAIYETQLAISQKSLNEDLEKICEHHLQTLTNEREKAARKYAFLKSDLKVKRQQRAVDLEADCLIGKQAKRRTQCPSPLTATKLKCKKITSEVASYATSPISKLIDMDMDA
jgi:hypothetical protein